ncbi:MAG: efflux RND transporter periplasmic adaptor subunit [Flavobacteriales bacterium]|nr:efflux RND transporter periplasmic adaptor subunit [Flavobacteriales bacterium]
MKQLIIALITASMFLACSKGGSDLDIKQKELTEKKKAYAKLKDEIEKLEKEIAELDTTRKDEGIAVMVDTIQPGTFTNPVTFQGLVSSDMNVIINPEIPSKITEIHVREGQRVYKGQVLVSLDGSTAQAQIAELENALQLAKTNYEKQKRLWDQKIGSEMQYLQAKNNYEGLQKSLLTAQVQLGKFVLRSPINGTVDEIFANEGQLVSNMGGPGVMRVVNLNDVEIKANVSESYISSIQVGQEVEVFYPSLNLTTREKISSVGNVIDPDNRTFTVILKPGNSSRMLKPNMLALISASDYNKSNVISVPTKLIRNDGKGNYVLTVDNEGHVSRSMITIEKQFARESVISSGLEAGDLLIVEGYNGVIAGDKAKIVSKK